MNITHKEVSYYSGKTRLNGVLVYDADCYQPRPGVVLAPNMMGITESNIGQADRVAKEGYIVLVADLYGCRPESAEQASAEMNALISTTEERQRMAAALKALAGVPPGRPDPACSNRVLLWRTLCAGACEKRITFAGNHLHPRNLKHASTSLQRQH